MAVILVTVVLAVLNGTIYNNRRLDDISARFGDVHRRIDDLRADMNARFAQVDARLSEMRADMNARLSELREDMNTRFSHIETRLDELRSLLQEKTCTG